MMGSVVAEVDRRLADTRAPGSPNKITAADLREWAVEYLQEYGEELDRFPELSGKPHWNLWMMDAESDDALFAVLVFHSTGIEFICGTGSSLDIQQWDTNEPTNPNGVLAELRQKFRVPEDSLSLNREAAEAWLGRGW